ncbi:MAG: hypothetical protein NTV02_02795 [Candidatus Zambryskibacteria bacterium]|nr:hypothetical protein [Candidatus Zambryskibacteria bacterium]
MNTQTYKNIVMDEKSMFWAFSAIIFFSAIFYMYCVTSTIHNVVARERLETKNSDLALSIGQKEFDLIGLKNEITIARAENLGFKEVAQKTFITRQSVSFVSRTESEI